MEAVAVIFQLFSITDLHKLTAAQLEELRACVWTEQRTLLPDVARALYPTACLTYQRVTGKTPQHAQPAFDPIKGLLGQVFHPDDVALLERRDVIILGWALAYALAHHPETVALTCTRAIQLFTAWTGEAPHGPDVPRSLRGWQ